MSGNGTSLDVGVVGLGAVGFEYAETIRDLGHELLGADAERSARDQFADQFDAATYETPNELYESGIDAVFITAPTKFHEDIAIPAFDAGIDVFFEKPLAYDLESAERIAEAATEADVRTMVGFPYRFAKQAQVLQSHIDDGYFGGLSHIRATHVLRWAITGRGSWYTSRRLSGGGALMDPRPSKTAPQAPRCRVC